MTMGSNVVKFPFSVSRRAHGTPEERPPGPFSTNSENQHLRIDRREVWRMAEAATRYWRLCLDFHYAVSSVQEWGMPEGRSHSAVNPDDRWPLLDSYRAALAKQFLTPAPDAASVKWKQMALAGDRHCYTSVRTERLECAIAEDLAFLAAHPVRQSKRRSRSNG